MKLGRECEYYRGQWELGYHVLPKEEEPFIQYCSHPENKNKREGSCNRNDCPKLNT